MLGNPQRALAVRRFWQLGRWRRLRDARDRGDATVEAVIIVPVIVVLTLLVVQFVLVWHGRHVAQAAAQTAARSAAAYQADPRCGQAAGDEYLAEVAPNLLPRPHGHRHPRRRRRHRASCTPTC